MRRTWAVGVVTFILAGELAAATQQGNSSEASLTKGREFTAAVMKKVVAGDDLGALELLRAQLPIAKDEFDATRDRTIEKRAGLGRRFGKIVGFQLVREERVSDVLVRVTYVEKRTKHLLRWQFVFYRPGAEWQLNSFGWDDNVAALFERGASPM